MRYLLSLSESHLLDAIVVVDATRPHGAEYAVYTLTFLLVLRIAVRLYQHGHGRSPDTTA